MLGQNLRLRVPQARMVRAQLVWSYGCARESLLHLRQLLLRLSS